jgi:hypothetical protein
MDENAKTGVDLRRTPRKAIRRPAQVMAQANTLMYAITTDISSTGLGLVVPYPLGSEKAYQFVFEVSIDNEKRQVHFSGVVAYCVAIGAKGYRTGIRIDEVHPTSQHTFNSLVPEAA